MILSILVPTTKHRKDSLDRLLRCLQPQLTDEVEVVIQDGEPPITTGYKRNQLLDRAKGKYIVFVDDDDLVAFNYIPKILDACKTDPDVIGIHLLHYEDYSLRGLTYHSLKYDSWWQEPNKLYPTLTNYYRNPNHINPVKRDLALQVRFPLKSMGEDKDYSMRLLPLLKTEEIIVDPIYCYLYRTVK